jgi:hypothetical protein
MHGRLVGSVIENIPPAENQVFQVGQRNKVFDLGAAAFGAFPEAHGSKLRERSDGLPKAALYRFNSRHERGTDRSNAGDQDPQLTSGGRNPGVSCGGQLRISLGGVRLLQSALETGLRRRSFAIVTFYVVNRVVRKEFPDT